MLFSITHFPFPFFFFSSFGLERLFLLLFRFFLRKRRLFRFFFSSFCPSVSPLLINQPYNRYHLLYLNLCLRGHSLIYFFRPIKAINNACLIFSTALCFCNCAFVNMLLAFCTHIITTSQQEPD
jgi:hypothetical protein